VAIPSHVHFPSHVSGHPSRLVWEAVAKLKASVFRSRDETVALARSGELYDEDYFTRRGGGSPYTGYPLHEDGSSGAEHAERLAQELIDEFGPLRILDIGCSTGVLVKELQERGADAWGIDLSEWAVDHAVCQKVIRANAQHLTVFDDASFDLLISQDFFEHVAAEQIGVVLAELRRVTRAGGWGLHFIPFYADFAEPIPIDAHLCTASKSWWDALFATADGFRVERDAPGQNQWEYSDGILSRYYWLRAV
jgi:SAM-dependent methyltransferase